LIFYFLKTVKKETKSNIKGRVQFLLTLSCLPKGYPPFGCAFALVPWGGIEPIRLARDLI
jgi:hypothetical protein